MRRIAVFASAAVAVGLLTAGCSSSTEAEQKTENANASACLALENLDATVAGLATGVTGTGDVTVSKGQEAINQISEAYQEYARELGKLSQDVQDQVLTDQQQFQEAQMQIEEGLSGLDGDLSLSDVPQEQAQAITQLQSSSQQMNETLGCS